MAESAFRRRNGLIAINLAAVIFGSAALFGKIPLSPLWIVGARAFFAAVVLGIFAVTQKEKTPDYPKFWPILAISGLLLAVHWLSFFGSVQSGGVAIATLTFASFPLFTVLLEAIIQRRAVHFIEVAAVAIMIAVGLLVHPDGQTKAQNIGIMMGLASAVTFALFGRLSQKLGHQGGAAWISCLQNIIVMLAILPVLWLVAPAPPQPPDWIWLILLGVVTTALMHQLYFYALQRLSATLCSAFVALEPVYAIVFAAWFFNEPLTPWLFVSGSLILGASIILLKKEKPVILTETG
jgi:drug/metabolite transporter (DMT)-like permease